MKAPEDCHDMTDLRAAIDALDAGIVAQLKARAGYIDRAAVLKQGNGLPARIDARVEEVVAKVRGEAQKQLKALIAAQVPAEVPTQCIVAEGKIYREILNAAAVVGDDFSEEDASVFRGRNINLECGSTHTAPLSAAGVANGCRLGIAFDGDGDGDGGTNHRVVAHSQKAHHFNVGRD